MPASVTVVFKEFGIRLNFKPTIAGDVIRLKVRPEVSSLDFNNGITLSGLPHSRAHHAARRDRRRAAGRPDVRDCRPAGQHLAERRAAIPILSKLPIIGALFKSKAKRAEQTELMVLITPRLVRPLDPDEVPPLPTDPDLFIDKTGDAGQEPRGVERSARRRRRARRRAAAGRQTRTGASGEASDET